MEPFEWLTANVSTIVQAFVVYTIYSRLGGHSLHDTRLDRFSAAGWFDVKLPVITYPSISLSVRGACELINKITRPLLQIGIMPTLTADLSVVSTQLAPTSANWWLPMIDGSGDYSPLFFVIDCASACDGHMPLLIEPIAGVSLLCLPPQLIMGLYNSTVWAGVYGSINRATLHSHPNCASPIFCILT